MTSDRPLVLLTGGTGYIGGRLLRFLEQRDLRVPCVCRQPERLRSRVTPTTEVVEGDVLAPDSLAAVMQGVHTAYYLVHSLGTKQDFERDDRQAAANFLPRPPEPQVSSKSSTLVAWAIQSTPFRPTFAAARRRARYCDLAASR